MKPNILLIQADQMTVRAMPFHGNPVVKAPTLGRLAAEARIFDAFYCNNPLCAPSRSSMLSGRLASRLGTYDNGAEFYASIPTIAHYLRDKGYRTCLSGKMHFIGPDQRHGFEERLTTDIYPSDFSWTADWTRSPANATAEMRVVTEAGPCKRSVQIDFDDEVAFRADRWLYALARNARRDPFFLVVSFTHPHDPFAIAHEYWNRYRQEDIDLPTLPRAEDPHSLRLRAHFGMDDAGIAPHHVRNARHAYYGAISYLDDKIAALLETLSACNLLDDTVVFVTSDHGEFLGERDLWFKRSFFEESVRVPMLAYAPKRWAAGRIQANSSLVDLLPTFHELAGGDVADLGAIDGRSLLPLLDGRKLPTTGDVYAEVTSEGTPAPVLMVKSGHHKYIHCEIDPPQLFDLRRDPREETNVAGVAAYREIEKEFQAKIASCWEIPALTQRVRESQSRRKSVLRALNRGQTMAWDYQPVDDAATAYYRNTLAFDVERLLDLAVAYGAIRVVGGRYLHNDHVIGCSQAGARDFLKSDLDIANALVRQIEEARSFLR